MSSVAASPLHRAMLLRVARTVIDRRDTLAGVLDNALLDAMEPAAMAEDLDLLALEARQDQRVCDALKAYHHAGGTVYNCLISLPAQPADRPPLPNSLRARLTFLGATADAAVVEDGGRTCRVDSRHAAQVIDVLAHYYRLPPQAFVAKPLAPGRWTTPDLPDERAAKRLIAERREAVPDDSLLGHLMR